MKYKHSSPIALTILLATGLHTLNAIAQTAVDNFTLPTTVPEGTKVQIDGSNSMQAVNQGLKERFQKQFPGTDISLPAKYQGSDAGVKAVEEGKADLASIGRLLTSEETAKGVAQKAIGRSKIAIIVKENNPYTGNLTLQDFAKIYRGEITDWSKLPSAKGAKGKIKVIDRPNSSDTRRAFANYPVFQNGKLKTGNNAVKLTEDSTIAVVNKLGADGIGYAPADQVKNISGIRAITLHNTQPDDPKYPFSQPLVYAYKNKGGKVSEGAKAFLGYAGDPTGQKAVTESIAAGVATADTTATTAADTTKTIETTQGANSTTTNSTVSEISKTTPVALPTAATPKSTVKEGFPWWLLPFIAAGAGLLWLLNKRDKSAATATRTAYTSTSSTRRATGEVDTYAQPTNYTSTSSTRRGTGEVDIHTPPVELSPDLHQVWLAVRHREPTSFNSIVTRSNLSTSTVSSALNRLESMGLITLLSDGKYQR